MQNLMKVHILHCTMHPITRRNSLQYHSVYFVVHGLNHRKSIKHYYTKERVFFSSNRHVSLKQRVQSDVEVNKLHEKACNSARTKPCVDVQKILHSVTSARACMSFNFRVSSTSTSLSRRFLVTLRTPKLLIPRFDE